MALSPLDRIDAEAIDGDLKKALRICLQLGGVIGSERLREWATWELDGLGVTFPHPRQAIAQVLGGQHSS
jgi:hypothetical protein